MSDVRITEIEKATVSAWENTVAFATNMAVTSTHRVQNATQRAASFYRRATRTAKKILLTARHHTVGQKTCSLTGKPLMTFTRMRDIAKRALRIFLS